MRKRPRLARSPLAAVVAVALIAAVAALVAAGSGSSSRPSPPASSSSASTSGFDGAALPGEIDAPSFTLSDQHGRRVSLGAYRGQVVVLSFLYSTCGATCILIAQQIRGALDELRRPPAVLIVSADPRADTPANVMRFLTEVSLAGRVEYLTGSPAELAAVWRSYRVIPASVSRSQFARFASLLLLDGRGRERVLFDPEVLTPEALAHDIRKLQAG